MKNIKKYLFTLASCVFMALSCTETIDPSTEVPEGVLRIFVNKETIVADGVDSVSFKVMFGSKDVSNEKTMNLYWVSGDKEEKMDDGAHTFTTTAAGTYVFRATLYSGGLHESDNEIVVTATTLQGERNYAQMVVGEQFTSVGCVNCPTLSEKIKEVQEQMPGVMAVLSFHMNYDIADPMSVDATSLFYKAYGMSGLPFFNLNMRKRDGGVNREAIKAAIEDELEFYPATCGVAIETAYDKSTRELVVTSKITSNVAARHKYHIFLVEDNIEYSQQGTTGRYIHNNVVRKMFAQDITGLNMNKKNPFAPGVEVTAENKTTLDKSWNADNMRVVVAALTTSDGGVTFTCNNANVCAVGESVGYLIK